MNLPLFCSSLRKDYASATSDVSAAVQPVLPTSKLARSLLPPRVPVPEAVSHSNVNPVVTSALMSKVLQAPSLPAAAVSEAIPAPVAALPAVSRRIEPEPTPLSSPPRT